MFILQPYTRIDKFITINGPGLDIMIDYDDVDHDLVDKQVKLLMAALKVNTKGFVASQEDHYGVDK